MKPFDLTKALAGEPIKFVGGNKKSYIIGETKTDKYRKGCYVVQIEDFNEDEDLLVVEYITALEMNYAMWEEPRPTVTLTLPCPLNEPQYEMWYIDTDFNVKKYEYNKENPVIVNPFYLQKGRYFASEEDAQAWLDAMKNNCK